MAVVTMRQLLESGVHFGHQTRRWNPKMKRFIMTERNGIYIIDLQQSVTYINNAYEFVRETVAHGGTILFVGTKSRRRSRSPSRRPASACPTSTTAGSVACSPTSRRSPSGSPASRSSRSSTSTTWPAPASRRRSCSSSSASRTSSSAPWAASAPWAEVPSAVWIVDTKKEHLAVDEARKLGLPVIAILDTNCDPDEVDYKIPGNDDAIRSVTLLTRVIADAVAEGLIARAGGPAAGEDVAADEPLAEWERELLGGDAAATAETVAPEAGETAAAAAEAAEVEVVETPAPEVAEAIAAEAAAEAEAAEAAVEEARRRGRRGRGRRGARRGRRTAAEASTADVEATEAPAAEADAPAEQA